MASVINITIRNRFIFEKRDLNVYHHYEKKAHFIGSSGVVTAALASAQDGDYLHISVVSGPGNLKYRNLINLPSWTDFEFYCEKTVIVSHIRDRIIVKIPEGAPPWQLRLTRSPCASPLRNSDFVTIGDEHSENK